MFGVGFPPCSPAGTPPVATPSGTPAKTANASKAFISFKKGQADFLGSAWPRTFLLLPQEELLRLLSAGRRGGRMNLLIAVVQRAAILNVGRPPVNRRRRERADRRTAALQCRQEVAVRLPKGSPECRIHRREVGPLAHFDTRLPRLEAIDIRRLDRTLRMESTRLAAILDIHPE